MTSFAEHARLALLEGRRLAESLMTDTVRVLRPVGVEVDDLTGKDVPVYAPDAVYEGRAKVQTYEPHEQTPAVGGRTTVVQRYHVHLPVSAGPFKAGDRVEVLTSQHNPHLPGTVYRVAGPHEKAQQTAQRVLVDEVNP